MGAVWHINTSPPQEFYIQPPSRPCPFPLICARDPKVFPTFHILLHMCFGLSSSKPAKPGLFPPRRGQYGDNYNQYLRDYDKYQKSKKEYAEWNQMGNRKGNRNRMANGNIATFGAGVAVAGGGGA